MRGLDLTLERLEPGLLRLDTCLSSLGGWAGDADEGLPDWKSHVIECLTQFEQAGRNSSH